MRIIDLSSKARVSVPEEVDGCITLSRWRMIGSKFIPENCELIHLDIIELGNWQMVQFKKLLVKYIFTFANEVFRS